MKFGSIGSAFTVLLLLLVGFGFISSQYIVLVQENQTLKTQLKAAQDTINFQDKELGLLETDALGQQNQIVELEASLEVAQIAQQMTSLELENSLTKIGELQNRIDELETDLSDRESALHEALEKIVFLQAELDVINNPPYEPEFKPQTSLRSSLTVVQIPPKTQKHGSERSDENTFGNVILQLVTGFRDFTPLEWFILVLNFILVAFIVILIKKALPRKLLRRRQ